jgi:hypothetical protein
MSGQLAATERTVRTYGGWRRARGIGLFGVGPTATAVVLACVIVPLLLASVSLKLGAIGLVPAAAVATFTLAQVNGMTLGQLALRRVNWWWASHRGWTVYRSTTVDQHPRAWDLPGVLAPTTLLSARDDADRPYGIVWNRRNGQLTATFRCAATSTWLVDGTDAEAWVSNWHSWLASLGYLPMVRSVAVTVDTAPEPGTALEDAVRDKLAAMPPEDVAFFIFELVTRSPAASADVDTRVSITFDPALATPRANDLDVAIAEVNRQLVGLESALMTCGVSVLGRATAQQLAGIVRTAFDPAVRGDIERELFQRPAGERTLTWADAGPVGASEEWDHYRHDTGVSVSWGWHEAPRQHVSSGVLARLLSPGRFAKRVTLQYRPLSAGDAARVLEGQVNAAAFREAYRRAQRRDETARDVADRSQAQRAATEEAQGAGVVLMSLFVTATVESEEDLAAATADIESRADQSKIRLRRLYGGQAAGFAATLPCGPGGAA